MIARRLLAVALLLAPAVALAADPARPSFSDRAKESFAKWDADKNGTLTREEIDRAVSDPGVKGADAAAIVLSGASWGGYLTLLGLGVMPDAWTVGIAGVPVADYVAAYEDEMEALRAFDRSLFGGTPDEMPDSYRHSSPISYVADVRAPVLVLAGANDPRCPIRQIENYLGRLAARSAPFEVYRFDAGHGSLVVEERIRQVEAELAFARRHLPH